MNTIDQNTATDQTTASVLGKMVRLQGAYRPSSPPPLVGRNRELCLITAAWIADHKQMPLAPLLVGQPGVGKNRLIYEIANKTGKDLYIFQGHDDVASEELACSVRFSDDDNRRMEYTASSLVTAMKLGQICFIDEIGKIRPRALSLLVSVLDERRYIESNLLGGQIAAHPGFRFIAATNTADLEGQAIPAFIQSRLHPVIHIHYPKRDEIDKIVKDHFLDGHDRLEDLLSTFWDEWKKLSLSRPPSPRDAISVFSLAASHSSFEPMTEQFINAPPGSVNLNELQPSVQGLEPKHVAQAIDDLRSDFVEV